MFDETGFVKKGKESVLRILLEVILPIRTYMVADALKLVV